VFVLATGVSPAAGLRIGCAVHTEQDLPVVVVAASREAAIFARRFMWPDPASVEHDRARRHSPLPTRCGSYS
jgi:hypothetical protein